MHIFCQKKKRGGNDGKKAKLPVTSRNKREVTAGESHKANIEKYFQWSRRRKRRNKLGDSDSAKGGQRGVMRKLRVITPIPAGPHAVFLVSV